MRKAAAYWSKVPATIRKPAVLIAGSAVILTGLALLVLPGPGWAVVFLGFVILSTEFAFAEKVRAWLVTALKRALSSAKQKYRQLRKPKA